MRLVFSKVRPTRSTPSAPRMPLGTGRRAVGASLLALGVPAWSMAQPPASGAAAPAVAAAPTIPDATPTTPAVVLSRLSVAAGRTAVLRARAGGGHDVLVGRGAVVVPAPGLAPLEPAPKESGGIGYSALHAGTDAAGKTVLVYPRCRVVVRKRAVDQQTCDLYAYDVDAGRERLIPGIRRRGRNEAEGVMERGALAYAAYSSKASQSGLWYRTAAGRERRVALNPGRDLALHGRRIASIVQDGAKEYGEEPCVNSTLIVRTTSGKTRVIARDCIDPYDDGNGWTAPSFLGGALYWAQDSGSGPALLRRSFRTGKVEQASVPGHLHEFQATSPTTGVATVTSGVAALASGELPDTLVAFEAIPWVPRIRSVIKTFGELYPGALR